MLIGGSTGSPNLGPILYIFLQFSFGEIVQNSNPTFEVSAPQLENPGSVTVCALFINPQ